ncbi:MAG: CNNM domain-containing protein, partial [Kiloniellales bacterium]|nr:CNNM domain-containing protein [Kiloniellales bacterium]
MILESIWFGITVIFFLILANGFFAASEIAIIATRKTRIDTLVEKRIRSAVAVARLKEDPDRFLATVQIGVTFVGTLASAIGGAGAVAFLDPLIQSS